MALCVALFFCTSKNGYKNVKNERKQYICQLFLANFQGNLENVRGAMSLCGAIFLYLEKRLKNVKNERKQYICQPFFSQFSKNLENVRGAMWRYFFVPRKTVKTRET